MDDSRRYLRISSADGSTLPISGRAVRLPGVHMSDDLFSKILEESKLGKHQAHARYYRRLALQIIGLHFGQMEIKTIMHNLLLRYEWSVPEGYEWKLDNSTLPVPKDHLPVRMRPLQAAP